MVILLIEAVLIFNFVNHNQANAAETAAADATPTPATTTALRNALLDLQRSLVLLGATQPEEEASMRQHIHAARVKMAKALADYAKTINQNAPADAAEDERCYQALLTTEHIYETRIDGMLAIPAPAQRLELLQEVLKADEQIAALNKLHADSRARQNKAEAESTHILITIAIAMGIVGIARALL